MITSIHKPVLTIKKVLTNVHTLLFLEGQLRSILTNLPVNKSDQPIPWYTYPAIDFIETIDFSKSVVFEYGSGSSTKFWMNRVLKIYTVEHDKQWFEKAVSGLNSKVATFLETDLRQYPKSINFSNEKNFDLIIVDGVERYKCTVEAIKHLKKSGLIILDNSDWHQKTAHMLRKKGFTQIDFFGFGPINDYKWSTSIFLQPTTRLQYKELQNVMGVVNQQEK